RTSLDEFPQFLNVLAGDMSVVGPRPLALTTGEVEALERDFGETAKKRANLLPGITGLWQVSGRSDVSSEQRFALDLFYIEHWSLGMDLEIIVKTPYVMLLNPAKGVFSRRSLLALETAATAINRVPTVSGHSWYAVRKPT